MNTQFFFFLIKKVPSTKCLIGTSSCTKCLEIRKEVQAKGLAPYCNYLTKKKLHTKLKTNLNCVYVSDMNTPCVSLYDANTS